MKKIATVLIFVLFSFISGYAKYIKVNHYDSSDSTYTTEQRLGFSSAPSENNPVKNYVTKLDQNYNKKSYNIYKLIKVNLDYDGSIISTKILLYQKSLVDETITITFSFENGYMLQYSPQKNIWSYHRSDCSLVAAANSVEELVAKIPYGTTAIGFIQQSAESIIEYKVECESQKEQNQVNKQFQYSINNLKGRSTVRKKR